jgi:hypothetical protein
MKLKTRNKETRFMNGNIDIDGEILNILINEHGQKAVYSSDFDTDNAIYSDGFISAIEEGKIPMLELHSTDSQRRFNQLEEYHHVIINDECYNVYFKDAE